RRDVLRREQEGAVPARPGRGAVLQRLGDPAAAPVVGIEPLPERTGELERRCRQVSDVQRLLELERRVRAPAERVQERDGDAGAVRLLRERPQARLLRRPRAGRGGGKDSRRNSQPTSWV